MGGVGRETGWMGKCMGGCTGYGKVGRGGNGGQNPAAGGQGGVVITDCEKRLWGVEILGVSLIDDDETVALQSSVESDNNSGTTSSTFLLLSSFSILQTAGFTPIYNPNNLIPCNILQEYSTDSSCRNSTNA